MYYRLTIALILTSLHFWRRVVGVKGTRASLAIFCSPEITESVRMQYSELTRNELDVVLLGHISALLSSNPDTAANNQRKRSNMAFYHGAAWICRITFKSCMG